MKNKKEEGPTIRYGGSLSIEERHKIIKEYLEGGQLKSEIWKKYTGQTSEHGNILRWMRQYGYISASPVEVRKPKSIILYDYPPGMAKKNQKSPNPEELQHEVRRLERELEDAKLKLEGYEIMLDIAEKEYNIPIRKKHDTK